MIMDINSIKNAILEGVRHFRKDHPNELEGRLVSSLVKRIVGRFKCEISSLPNPTKAKK